MSSPLVLATSDAIGEGVFSLDVPTPTGTSSGDLLLVIVTVDDVTVTTSMSGFTELFHEISETFVTASSYYRIADGTEGANLTIVLTGAPEQIVARAYRISDYSGIPEFEVVSTGNSTTQTSPPITPAGGSADYLYIVADHIDTNNGVINTFPTGYVNTGQILSSRCRMGFGEKPTLATTSETPTDWVLSAARRSVSSTFAISPVVAGGITITPDAVNTSSVSLDPVIEFNSLLELTPITVNSSSISLNPLIAFESSLTLEPNETNSSSAALNPTILFSGILEINPNAVNSSSVALNPTIQFTSSLNLLPGTVESLSVALNPVIEYTSSLVINAQTVNSASISLDPTIKFISVINLSPDTVNSLSISHNPIITTGEQQIIGTVTAGFKDDQISVKYKILGITVNFKE